MYLENYYWYFEDVIPHRICDEIIKIGESRQKLQAVTGQTPEEKKETDIEKQRDSTVSWLSEPWIYQELNPYIFTANKNAGWNFEWDWNEPCQYTTYDSNQFYDWHQDQNSLPFKDEDININGKIRKLSLTLSLNNSSEYEGGVFQFDYRNYNPNKVEEKDRIISATQLNKKGSIIIFPSFVWHRVTKVTKGQRKSLVNWSLGAKFI